MIAKHLPFNVVPQVVAAFVNFYRESAYESLETAKSVRRTIVGVKKG